MACAIHLCSCSALILRTVNFWSTPQVMSTLQHLAACGHTVVCSIHQPRSSIFSLFDDLLLLAEGSVVYHGPAGDVLDHFAALGHPCPEHYNPAGEWGQAGG